MMDREMPNIIKSQTGIWRASTVSEKDSPSSSPGFIDFFVLPFYTLLNDFLLDNERYLEKKGDALSTDVASWVCSVSKRVTAPSRVLLQTSLLTLVRSGTRQPVAIELRILEKEDRS